MHDTADELGALFFATYLTDRARFILDVGSADVNGTLRHHAPPSCAYVGIDLSPGAGVDVVLEEPYKYPFQDNYFDAVVSTSSFEHDQFFWLTFLEMTRVIRPGGYIYINCPSNGVYHAYPSDNWRFYPDAGLALSAWAAFQQRQVTLVESFIAFRKQDIWNDCVMVFYKGHAQELGAPNFISDTYRCYNRRRFSEDGLSRCSFASEDVILLENAGQTVARDGTSDIRAGIGESQDAPAEAAVKGSLAAGLHRIAALKEQLATFHTSIEALQARTEKAMWMGW